MERNKRSCQLKVTTSSSSTTMKTIQKHLCTVLPRVRSNSVSSPRLYSNSASLSLFDSSAPPPSRPVLSSSRLSIEGKPAEVEGAQNSQHHSHSHPPFSLALTQPQSSSGPTLANTNPQGQYALFPYSSLTQPSCVHPQPAQQPAYDHAHPRPKRQRLRYQLDVGAYGIPKRCRAVPSSSRRHHTYAHQYHSLDDLSLSVQVGEDAYFIRDNAMGVADGVGGWSKSHSRPSSTPSALFARRLMHFCSAEVETATTPSPSKATPIPVPTAPVKSYPGSHPFPPSRSHFSFTHHLKPRRPTPTSPAWKWSGSSMSSSLPASWTLHDVFNVTPPSPAPPAPEQTNTRHSPFFSSEQSTASLLERDQEDLEQDLEDSLEELSEGIDVLQILERAYDRTLKAHVVPSSDQPPLPSRTEPSTPVSATASTSATERESQPLLAGSSTALLAVLDHPPRPPHAPTVTSTSTSTTHMHTSTSKAAETPLAAAAATATSSTSAFTDPSTVECELEECLNDGEYDAVIKIAHVGDCMGMLVRGEDIVWRSEEMWWDVSVSFPLIKLETINFFPLYLSLILPFNWAPQLPRLSRPATRPLLSRFQLKRTIF